MKDTNTVENKAFRRIYFRIISGFIYTHKPKDLFLFTVDNWFDSKWLNFSGKALGAVGVWKAATTVPPFNPNRIKYETHFQRVTITDVEAMYRKITPKNDIHIFLPSSENLNRKLGHFTNDGAFIWESANTENNDYGSLMIYLLKDNEIWTWYVGLKNNGDEQDDWEIHQTVGISREEVRNFLLQGKKSGLAIE